MKAEIFDLSGKKKGEIELPSVFNTTVRYDLVKKSVESTKFKNMQPYSVYDEAGKRHSAAGTISHKRHEWKGHYGKGISRAPRKTMWRRGTQFYWVGAESSSSRGGRTAHPPQGNAKVRKINKKESRAALNSGFAATAQRSLVLSRYASLKELKSSPFVIESLPAKTKDMFASLKNIFGESFSLVLKKKEVRSGKGKSRGRKYKSNAGLLLVVSKKEKQKFKGIEVKNLSEINILDLFPLGRLTLYTKESLEEMKNAA